MKEPLPGYNLLFILLSPLSFFSSPWDICFTFWGHQFAKANLKKRHLKSRICEVSAIDWEVCTLFLLMSDGRDWLRVCCWVKSLVLSTIGVACFRRDGDDVSTDDTL